jgi:hypothetical protein
MITIQKYRRATFMPGIKFNQLTREIEIKGSESFIELNFDRIRDLLVESVGVGKKMALKEAKTIQEPISVVIMKDSQADPEIRINELSGAYPISTAEKPFVPEFSKEFKAKRPPLRKYIRREGEPGHQRIVVEIAEQKRSEISIASLKEKFGLSDSKIGGIIRDAEKLGKIRRVMNGSYAWAQD